MQVILSNSADKFLDKQCDGDPKGIYKVRAFLATLDNESNPTALPNCKKVQGVKDLWRWRVGHYRIVGFVKSTKLIIEIIKISTRENAY